MILGGVRDSRWGVQARESAPLIPVAPVEPACENCGLTKSMMPAAADWAGVDPATAICCGGES